MIESLADRCYLLSPSTPEDVQRALADLAVGRAVASTFPASVIASFCELASRVSANRVRAR